MLSNWRVGSCPCGVVTPRGILPSTTDCGSKAEWTSDIDWYNRIQPDWCLIVVVVLSADLIVIFYFDRLSLWHIQRPFQKGASPVYAEQALTALWTQVPSYCIYVLYLFSDSYIHTYVHTSPAIHDVSAPPSNGRIGYYGLIRLTPFSFVSTIIAFFLLLLPRPIASSVMIMMRCLTSLLTPFAWRSNQAPNSIILEFLTLLRLSRLQEAIQGFLLWDQPPLQRGVTHGHERPLGVKGQPCL